MAIPANRDCRSPCRPVVASVAASCRQRVTEPGSATVVGLRHGWDWPPRPGRAAPPGIASVTAWRSPRAPAQPWGWWPAPRPRKTSYEAASAFAGEPEVYRGSFVRLIVRSSASLASRWKLPPGKGPEKWVSTLPIQDALHRRRTAAVLGETGRAHIVHGGGVPGSEVFLDQLLHGVLLQLGLGQQPLQAVSAASLFRRLVASACPTGARRRVL